ncbi:MAG: type II secretion system inner membrane protein GspF [Proteobacteria bacterium]|nr:type II secretion system inner membrane protein GspF [Pseudomonadota bacterium]
MANFEVKGSNAQGKEVKIYIESDSLKGARAKARSQGIIPLSVTTTEQAATNVENAPKTLKSKLTLKTKVSVADLSNMTRQLSTLVKAHVPIVESLSALIEQIQNPKIQPILMQIRQNVKEGHSLADSFAMYPDTFNRVYVNMVRAGESSGRLDVVLTRLADFSENQVKLRNKVTSAMTYPIIMIGAGFLALIVIFTLVIPKILTIFEDMKSVPPLSTRILIAASNFAQNYGMLTIVAALLAAVMLERFLKTEKGRDKKDQILLKAPLFKDLMVSLVIARMARTLGVLLNSGVPMLTALKITRNVVNNTVFEAAIDNASELISQGRSLGGSLKQSGLFPPIVLHMVGVGEKTGELENMLISVADNYDQEIDTKLGRFTSILEPMMILIMVGVVGFIVMAVLQPLLEMQNLQ